jgi:hypothetical protein
LPGRIPAPPGTAATIIRYPLSATGGSSGSGLYDTATKRIVGIHSRSELDPVCVLPGGEKTQRLLPIIWPLQLRSTTAPEFQEFVRMIMIPHLMRIRTAEARTIAAEWIWFMFTIFKLLFYHFACGHSLHCGVVVLKDCGRLIISDELLLLRKPKRDRLA